MILGHSLSLEERLEERAGRAVLAAIGSQEQQHRRIGLRLDGTGTTTGTPLREAAESDYGIAVVDIRLRRSNHPPAVRDARWPRTGIDRFILARLEARGLGPAPEADRRTLIRRLSFDLIGLPPEPDEVERFVADPADDAVFRANADGYLAKLDGLDRDVRRAMAQIPPTHRKVISTHDAFGYFAAAYGVEFIAPLGVSTDSEPSARDIAGIITQIRAAKIPAVFLENISDPRLMQRISAETGARIGGTLYSDGLTGEKGEAPTYIDMVRHNIRALTDALEGPP